MFVYPSRVRLCIWIFFSVAIIGLILWEPDFKKNLTPTNVVSEERIATTEEYAQSIAELGQRRIAKRIVLLTKISFRGDLVWWHDGKHAQWAYIPAADEQWQIMWQKIARAIVDKRAHIMAHPGDEALLQTFPDFATPFDRLPNGWTIVSHP